MVIRETSVFTKQVDRLLDAESYRLLQLRLVADPEAGELIGEPADCERSGGRDLGAGSEAVFGRSTTGRARTASC